MRDFTFKKLIICSAFQKSSLYPFDLSMVLLKFKEFIILKQILNIKDSSLELGLKVDF
jgi:hypothetical protein